MPQHRINGVNLWYEQAGQGSPTLVLLHGNLASKRWWDLVFPMLAETYTVVRVDLRGNGESEQADSYSIPEYGADVREQIKALGLTDVIVVGHSMGGAVAMDIAANEPELIRGFLLLNSAPIDGMDASEEIIPLLVQMSQDRNLMKMSLAATVPTAASGELFEALVDDAMLAASTVVPNYKSIGSIDYRLQLAETELPCKIVYGTLDNLITREMVDRTQQAIPGSELVLLEGVGHGTTVEAPERVVAEIHRFVARVMGAGTTAGTL